MFSEMLIPRPDKAQISVKKFPEAFIRPHFYLILGQECVVSQTLWRTNGHLSNFNVMVSNSRWDIVGRSEERKKYWAGGKWGKWGKWGKCSNWEKWGRRILRIIEFSALCSCLLIICPVYSSHTIWPAKQLTRTIQRTKQKTIQSKETTAGCNLIARTCRNCQTAFQIKFQYWAPSRNRILLTLLPQSVWFKWQKSHWLQFKWFMLIWSFQCCLVVLKDEKWQWLHWPRVVFQRKPNVVARHGGRC